MRGGEGREGGREGGRRSLFTILNFVGVAPQVYC